ncbi:L,D-transpeptidase family protein [Streptomyces sp. 7N604]|uniref:L,D-transpeptidase family protein n=1 Tax=Streptomyces sp. 7N604 TaxID=3457415 RepID=UPI003FD10D07
MAGTPTRTARIALACALAAAFLLGGTRAAGAPPGARPGVPLPERMADTGGGTQLITAEAPGPASTTGTVTWWQKRDGRWRKAGSSAARFGAGGLVEGGSRKQGTSTTPTGLYDLPFAFGTEAAPGGTSVPYRRVTGRSWWCQDAGSASYNRWVEPLPRDCAAKDAERLASYPTQYARALVIGFNYTRPVRGRGAGIFLHVNGRGATAGCVSVPRPAMDAILAWADPAARPHIAMGTRSGPTAISRY